MQPYATIDASAKQCISRTLYDDERTNLGIWIFSTLGICVWCSSMHGSGSNTSQPILRRNKCCMKFFAATNIGFNSGKVDPSGSNRDAMLERTCPFVRLCLCSMYTYNETRRIRDTRICQVSSQIDQIQFQHHFQDIILVSLTIDDDHLSRLHPIKS